METRKEVFESVKDGVVGTIRGTGDVAKAVVDTIVELSLIRSEEPARSACR